MRNYAWAPDICPVSMGTLFLIVNNVPEVSNRDSFSAFMQVCEGVRKNDPFCVVYLQDDARRWYKGEYCYANQRYKFSNVGLSSVPDVILMMQLVAP
jgi:hypothetical protein